jgi:hypothetical protein
MLMSLVVQLVLQINIEETSLGTEYSHEAQRSEAR